MEAISSSAHCDVDKNLKELLKVFGSSFSLEDIASAYCQARQHTNLAAEILCGMHAATSTTITTEKLASENASPLKWSSGFDSTRSVSSELASGNDLEKTSDGQKKTKELKSKKCSASMGTVSSVIGKQYSKTRPQTNEFIEVNKPLKLESKDFPVSVIWSEKNESRVTTKSDHPHTGMEEFLFKMLGDGFQLDMPVIQEVLGLCGFDMQKGIDKLLDLSASTLENCEDFGMAAENESILLQEQMQQIDSAESDGAELMARDLIVSPKEKKDRIGLQKELLQALFDVPDRSEEAPKMAHPRRVAAKRSKAFGKLVVELPKDAAREHKPSAAEPQVVAKEDKAEVDENSYEVLRTAVKEYWITMKEYYKAAVDAFVKGDHARAQKLLEQGQLFNKRAREADDKSCQKLIEPREEEVVSLRLHDLDRKESLRLLRLHLTSLSGIPSIKYLRVTLESDEEDKTKEARKRLILKQLEKESIKWNEEDNGKTILIQVDTIDPKGLSFAKKHGVGDQSKIGPKTGNLGYYF